MSPAEEQNKRIKNNWINSFILMNGGVFLCLSVTKFLGNTLLKLHETFCGVEWIFLDVVN